MTPQYWNMLTSFFFTLKTKLAKNIYILTFFFLVLKDRKLLFFSINIFGFLDDIWKFYKSILVDMNERNVSLHETRMSNSLIENVYNDNLDYSAPQKYKYMLLALNTISIAHTLQLYYVLLLLN